MLQCIVTNDGLSIRRAGVPEQDDTRESAHAGDEPCAELVVIEREGRTREQCDLPIVDRYRRNLALSR